MRICKTWKSRIAQKLTGYGNIFLHKSYISDFRWLCALFSWQLEPQWEKILLNALVPSCPAPNTQLCHPRTSLFTVDIKKKNHENGGKLHSLLYCVPFSSGFFPFTFLPYVCVSSCTYTQDSQKKKKNRSQRRKKLKSLLPMLLQKHCLQEGKEK